MFKLWSLFTCSLLVFSSLLALDRLDIKKAFKARDFKAVLRMHKKYPSLFSSGESLYFLAFSLRKIGRTSDGVAFCARAAIEMKEGSCYRFLQNLRKMDLGAYRLGLAKYHFDSGDLKKAFHYFFEKVQKSPSDPLARIYLARIFNSLQKKDLVIEQLWEIKGDPQPLHTIRAKLGRELKQVRHTVSRLKPPYSEGRERILYLYSLSDSSPSTEVLSFLESLYTRVLSTAEATPRIRLKLGNIFLFQGKLEALKKLLQEMDSFTLQPMLVLSLDSLKRRLAQKTPEKSPLISNQVRKDEDAVQISEFVQEPVPGEQPQKMDLRFLDLGELRLATSEDLSPIHRLVKSIRQRLDGGLKDYEKRWMLREMDRADSELMKHEKSRGARELYSKTSEGKAIRQEFEKLQKQFEAEDRKNAGQFKGEYHRFTQAMVQAKSSSKKKKTFLRFMERWWSLSQGDGVNLVTQGAMNAFRKTPEGQKLAREVYKLGLELKLKPPGLEMDEAFFQDRGF